VILCSTFCFYPLTVHVDVIEHLQGLQNHQVVIVEFQLVEHVTRMTRQQAKTNVKEKSLMISSSIKSHKKFLSQILHSLLLFHKRSTTLQNDKEDAHRLPFL